MRRWMWALVLGSGLSWLSGEGECGGGREDKGFKKYHTFSGTKKNQPAQTFTLPRSNSFKITKGDMVHKNVITGEMREVFNIFCDSLSIQQMMAFLAPFSPIQNSIAFMPHDPSNIFLLGKYQPEFLEKLKVDLKDPKTIWQNLVLSHSFSPFDSNKILEGVENAFTDAAFRNKPGSLFGLTDRLESYIAFCSIYGQHHAPVLAAAFDYLTRWGVQDSFQKTVMLSELQKKIFNLSPEKVSEYVRNFVRKGAVFNPDKKKQCNMCNSFRHENKEKEITIFWKECLSCAPELEVGEWEILEQKGQKTLESVKKIIHYTTTFYFKEYKNYCLNTKKDWDTIKKFLKGFGAPEDFYSFIKAVRLLEEPDVSHTNIENHYEVTFQKSKKGKKSKKSLRVAFNFFGRSTQEEQKKYSTLPIREATLSKEDAVTLSFLESAPKDPEIFCEKVRLYEKLLTAFGLEKEKSYAQQAQILWLLVAPLLSPQEAVSFKNKIEDFLGSHAQSEFSPEYFAGVWYATFPFKENNSEFTKRYESVAKRYPDIIKVIKMLIYYAQNSYPNVYKQTSIIRQISRDSGVDVGGDRDSTGSEGPSSPQEVENRIESNAGSRSPTDLLPPVPPKGSLPRGTTPKIPGDLSEMLQKLASRTPGRNPPPLPPKTAQKKAPLPPQRKGSCLTTSKVPQHDSSKYFPEDILKDPEFQKVLDKFKETADDVDLVISQKSKNGIQQR